MWKLISRVSPLLSKHLSPLWCFSTFIQASPCRDLYSIIHILVLSEYAVKYNFVTQEVHLALMLSSLKPIYCVFVCKSNTNIATKLHFIELTDTLLKVERRQSSSKHISAVEIRSGFQKLVARCHLFLKCSHWKWICQA